MKTIINITLLLLAASFCVAQQIIVGDPAEPCGPPKPDYWIGRARTPIRRGEGQGRGQTQRQLQKTFTAAALDSYAFGSNVRVNDNPAGMSFASTYSSGGHSIAARGDTVYLVWRSDHTGTSQIYFDKSVNGGATWGTDVAISDNPTAAGVMPALALGQDGTIYVSWTDWRDGNRHIYFAKSTNGGASFTAAMRVQPATEDRQQSSSIAVNDSGYVFIAYEDFRNLAATAIDIYCSRSIDGGNSFEPAVRVNSDSDSISQWYPSMAVIDSTVFIVWKDFRDTAYTGGGDIICFSKSHDYGVTFNNRILVNDTTGLPLYNVDNPSVAITDTTLYVAWLDTRNSGNCDIYFTKSIDGGQTFLTPNINLVDAAGMAYYQGYPSLACDDSGGVYCAFEDLRDQAYYPASRHLYYGFSKNYGDSFSLNYHLDDRPLYDSAWLFTPTICANTAGKLFSAWTDNRNSFGGSYDVYTTAGHFVGVEGQPTYGIQVDKTGMKLYPNPFTTALTIEYQLMKPGNVGLFVYNITGQRIKTIFMADHTPGNKKTAWSGQDDQGEKVPTGIYFVCLNTKGKSVTKRITFIK